MITSIEMPMQANSQTVNMPANPSINPSINADLSQAGVLDLSMSFLLKIGDRFYHDYEVVDRIGEFRALVQSKSIDIENPIGALSILFEGDELLGSAYWDEVVLSFDYLIQRLEFLQRGKIIAEFFPLQMYWVRLTPQPDKLLFEVESKTSQRHYHLHRVVPYKPFIQELVATYVRMVKLMAALGSEKFIQTEQAWTTQIPIYLTTMVEDVNQLQNIVRMPLEAVHH